MPRSDRLANFSSDEVSSLIARYLAGEGQSNRFPDTFRYASFDHCYTHFRQFAGHATTSEIADEGNIETSCLQLGFYLASWGMYRGSTDLLQLSSRALIPVIKYLAELDEALWTVDVPAYDEDSIEALMSAFYGMYPVLQDSGISPTLTLRTKIMLGTLGCVPAFDNYFAKATGSWRLSSKFLMRLQGFYLHHEDVLVSSPVMAVPFSGGEGVHPYPIAKLLDMVFFQKGLDRSVRSRS